MHGHWPKWPENPTNPSGMRTKIEEWLTLIPESRHDMASIQSDMGYTHMAVFYAHYQNALTKREALPYWEILPPGVEITKLESVA
jgi:hypothetical protein